MSNRLGGMTAEEAKKYIADLRKPEKLTAKKCEEVKAKIDKLDSLSTMDKTPNWKKLRDKQAKELKAVNKEYAKASERRAEVEVEYVKKFPND